MRKLAILATGVALAAASLSAFAQTGKAEQVWDAEVVNDMQTCMLNNSNSSHVGGILLKGESQSSGPKGIAFDMTTNAPVLEWQLTEAKITQNAGRFPFADDLMTISSTNETSVVINDQEYAWANVNQAHALPSGTKHLTLAPKINMDKQNLPTGVTHIQGKIVITCSTPNTSFVGTGPRAQLTQQMPGNIKTNP